MENETEVARIMMGRECPRGTAAILVAAALISVPFQFNHETATARQTMARRLS
jgi:hypothetical protein